MKIPRERFNEIWLTAQKKSKNKKRFHPISKRKIKVVDCFLSFPTDNLSVYAAIQTCLFHTFHHPSFCFCLFGFVQDVIRLAEVRRQNKNGAIQYQYGLWRYSILIIIRSGAWLERTETDGLTSLLRLVYTCNWNLPSHSPVFFFFSRGRIFTRLDSISSLAHSTVCEWHLTR